MEATKNGMVGGRRLRMAGDLLWFAGVSMAVGLVAAVAMAAVAMLLAQPARAAAGPEPAEKAAVEPCDPALFADKPMLPDECSHPLFVILEREEAFDQPGMACGDGFDRDRAAEPGFLRVPDREPRDVTETLRRS
jgi:hypothetical protein